MTQKVVVEGRHCMAITNRRERGHPHFIDLSMGDWTSRAGDDR